jgi:glycosyltransferase involved in cell wall biosynthesis
MSTPLKLEPFDEGKLLLSVVIPVYNEEATLEAIVERVVEEPTPKELVLVDDGSSDRSLEILAQLEKRDDVRVFRHAKNRGKGAALQTGFREAQGNVVIVQDADLEYDPNDYAALLKPIRLGRGRCRLRLTLPRARICTRAPLLALPRQPHADDVLQHHDGHEPHGHGDLLQGLPSRSARAHRAQEPPLRRRAEITAKIAKLRCKVYEVPISYSGRDFSEGKKISWRDGFAALRAILKYRFFN